MVAEVTNTPYHGDDPKWAKAVAISLKKKDDAIELLQKQIKELIKKANVNY